MARLSRFALGAAGLVATTLLCGCASTNPVSTGPDMTAGKGCYGDKPMAERLVFVRTYLDTAFADAPPLSRAEHEEISRLAACYGGAVLGVGDGCPSEWAQARASGLAERNRVRGAEYSIPDRLISAQTQPDRSSRIRDLTVALSTTNEAHATNALRHAAGKIDDDAYERTATALNIIEGTLQDTIACEALR